MHGTLSVSLAYSQHFSRFFALLSHSVFFLSSSNVLVHPVIPRQLVITQLADVITEHTTTLPRDDGSQTSAFDS